MKSRLFMLSMCAVALAGLAACENTVHGAGQDIENAGESIQKNVPPKR